MYVRRPTPSIARPPGRTPTSPHRRHLSGVVLMATQSLPLNEEESTQRGPSSSTITGSCS
jgi:hypothetical protein